MEQTTLDPFDPLSPLWPTMTCNFLFIFPSTHRALASPSFLLPPPRLEHVQPARLLQLQDRAADRRPVGRARRERDPIALGVEQPADLSRVALALDDVLDGGGLHEEGVLAVALLHALDALSVALDEDGRLRRLHERPHALVSGDLGVLEGKKKKK